MNPIAAPLNRSVQSTTANSARALRLLLSTPIRLFASKSIAMTVKLTVLFFVALSLADCASLADDTPDDQSHHSERDGYDDDETHHSESDGYESDGYDDDETHHSESDGYNAADDALELYVTQIKPLLKARCFACHGALKQEADLRLDTAELMVEAGVVSRGAATTSSLIDRVSSPDSEQRMPPEHLGEPLSREQIELLSDWIARGAPAPADERPERDPRNHWAFQPLLRPVVPAVHNALWVRNPIDAFIAQAHEQRGLEAQPEASRAILLRRLYLDLVGIPPTHDEIVTFENDTSSQWYENVVERLLDDPRHGERWARHWMDIWRYSDWWGLGDQLRNSQKHIWHWRDWIVQSLNDDRGYDDMVRWMLAGDELHPNDPQALAATGYLARNYFLFNRYQWLDETVEHVGKAFLGLTFNCAKCHDHKFDPISQVDYYKLQSFFEPYHVRVDMLPGQVDLANDGVPRAFDGVLDAPTYLLVRGEEGHPDKSRVIEPGLPAFLISATGENSPLAIESICLPAEAWQPARRSWVLDNFLASAQSKIETAIAQRQRIVDAQSGTPEVSSDVQATLQLASLDVDIAQAELESIVRRYAAMQAQWQVTEQAQVAESPGDSQDATSSTDSQDSASRRDVASCDAKTIAIRAEQRVTLLKAQRVLLGAQHRSLTASEETREAIAKEQAQAQQAIDQAQQSLDGDIQPDASFAPLLGAQWSATRFLNTGQDDPAVDFPSHSTGRRTALARWITDRHNPLTARVAVNHLWTRHMGTPLVSSVFDLGRNGSEPTNAALLDWLAVELVDSGWSMKHIHRLIVKSSVYRMSSSSAGGQNQAAIDPDNRWWWRREPIRLESQVVRDSVLSLAGTLDLTMGGPPVPADAQSESTRRSLYFFHSNNQRDLFLTMFDEALVTDCYRREQSIVPQQALALTNSKLVLSAADKIAERISVEGQDRHGFIARAFETLLGTRASQAELAACAAAMTQWEKQDNTTASQARSHLVWVLLNHNDFVTVR